METIPCRQGCGACCIAPSIASPLPGMPHGKPSGVRCVHLTDDSLCALHGKSERPKFCESYQATEDLCGTTREEAMGLLERLEALTR